MKLRPRTNRSLHLLPFFAAFLSIAAASSCYAGAWTEPQGEFYEKVSYNYYYAHQDFDSASNRVATPNGGKFTDLDVNNYIEYGLTNDLTVINSLTYKWLRNDFNGGAATSGSGLGDVDLGLRYKLLDKSAGIVSTQVLVKFPGVYGVDDSLPLGNGQYDAELRLLYGRSLYPVLPAYMNLEIGYRWRVGAPADELRYLVEFGDDLTSRLFVRAKLDGTLSMKNGASAAGSNFSANPTATNNYDLGKLDLAVGYKITPSFGVEVSYRPDIYGWNTAAGANYSLALYYKSL